MIDRYTGTLSVLRVVSGTLRARAHACATPPPDHKERHRQADAAARRRARGRPGGRARATWWPWRSCKTSTPATACTAEKGGVRAARRSPFRRVSFPTPSRRNQREMRIKSSPRSADSWRKIRRSISGASPSTGRVPAHGHGRAARAHDRAEAAAHVRRGGRAQDAEGALPRDDHAQGRERRGQAQEADRGQGHVRRLLPDGRAAAPWGGHRVRGRDRRRRDPAQPDPRGREGRAGGLRRGPARRLSRSSTSACAASTASTTRSTRTRWPSSWPAPSASRPPSSRRARRCSSRSWTSKSSVPGELRGRHHGRPLEPPRPRAVERGAGRDAGHPAPRSRCRRCSSTRASSRA